ncbi:MAG: aminoglycoside phosphotransferase, partial [Pseudomonadota bacterium]|nr:aminoglycoside phosphotransferase [Pseudomonadota bacterium]
MSQAECPSRLEQLRHWAHSQHPHDPGAGQLVLAAGDASFRRYYRLTLNDGQTRILMDAPPPQEDVAPFVDIARRWRSAGLPAPAIHAVDPQQGFVELE